MRRLRQRATCLEALERCANEGADGVEDIATLLDEDRRQPEGSQSKARFAKACLGHAEWRVRVTGGSIHAERDDQRLALMRACRLEQKIDPGEPQIVGRAGLEGHVQVRSVTRSAAALVRESEEVGEPAARRVYVHRTGEHVVTFPEDRLGSVTVVCVDVEDGNTRAPAVAQVLSRHRRVVQVAGASECLPRHVVPGRAAAGVRSPLPAEDEIGRRQGSVDGPASSCPRPGGDAGHGVVAIRTSPG